MGRPRRGARRARPLDLELRTGPHLAAGGEAVATAADGRRVFVAGAAPDEHLRARVTQDNKRFLRAKALSVIEPGPARVKPACVHFGRCGGCSLQHLAAAAQTEGKDQALTQTLQRVGKVRAAQRPAPWAGAPYGYRARLRLAWAAGGVGLRAAGSRAVVSLSACPVLAPELERAAVSLCQRLSGRRPPREVELRLLTNGERVQLSAPPGCGLPSLPDGVELSPAAGPPEQRAIDAADGLGPLWQSAGLFAQANRAGNAAILADLDAQLAALGPIERAFELYAGAGNLTRRLCAAKIPQITATELNPEATAYLKAALGGAVEVWADSDLAALSRLPEGGVDVVLVDPPRAGLPEALPAALAAKTGALFYVSCNPASFARDAGRLAQHGLQLRWARLYDLYPQTAHQELFGVFTRA